MNKLSHKPFVVDVMVLDVPNTNGRLYPRAVFDKELARLAALDPPEPMLGAVITDAQLTNTGVMPPWDKPQNEKDAAFIAEPFIADINDNAPGKASMLRARIQLLDTPAGKSLLGFIEVSGDKLRGACSGVGNADCTRKDGIEVVLEGYQLTTIGLVLEEKWGGGPKGEEPKRSTTDLSKLSEDDKALLGLPKDEK